MNDFLIKEIEKAYTDIDCANSYCDENTIRRYLNRSMGRIETIIELLKNKTIVVKYKGE